MMGELAASLGPDGKLYDPIVKGKFYVSKKTAVIDLGDFDDDGNIVSSGISSDKNAKNVAPLATQLRIENLARVIEHEYLGHGVGNLDDDGFNGLGAVENKLNVYRSQMCVPTRDSYNYSSDTYSKPNFMDPHPKPVIHQVGKTAHDAAGNKYEILYDLKKLETSKHLFSIF